jgi:hypothetical protein
MNLDAFAKDVRHLGLTRTAVRSAYDRVHRRLRLRLIRFLALEPAAVNRELLDRPVPYECRVLEDAELRELSRDPENQMSDRFLAGALAKRDACFGILDGGVLASFGWYSNLPTTFHRTLRVRFDRRYLYMYHGYTRPTHRGRNLHGIGLARACLELCARGHDGIVTIAERVNFASLVSARRVGFRDCGTALLVGAGARTRVFQTPTPRRYALRLEPSTRVDAGDDA